MTQVLAVVALLMSESNIVKQLNKSIQDYKECPTEENKAFLTYSCVLFLTKRIVGDDADKAHNLISGTDRIERLIQMMDVKPN